MPLRQANKRFRQRFGYIEERLNSEGRGPENASLEEMEALWQEAKNNPQLADLYIASVNVL